MGKAKMYKIFGFSFLCLFSFAGEASQSIYKVRSTVGAVFCGDKVIRAGDVIHKSCYLTTHAGSNVYLERENQLVSIGENAKVQFNGANNFKMTSGIARAKAKKEIVINTNLSSVKVKNAEALVRTNDIFGETEVISLSGIVILSSLSSMEESAQITSSHWGGIGGRFSRKIGDLFVLNKGQMEIYQSILKVNK